MPPKMLLFILAALIPSALCATSPTPVYPSDYGAQCDGTTDDAAAYQAAANAAIVQHRALHLGGAGICKIGSTISIQSPITMIGDGTATSVLKATFNGPLFTWTIANGYEASYVANVQLISDVALSADYSQTAVFKIRGTGSGNYFQHNTFENIAAYSFYKTFDVEGAPTTPAFTTRIMRPGTSIRISMSHPERDPPSTASTSPTDRAPATFSGT